MADENIMGDDISNIVLAPVKRKKGAKSKVSISVTSGIATVLSTFNNTKITISDLKGNVIAWCSAGKIGFKGSRKSTAYAAQLAGAECAKRAMTYGMKDVNVRIKGPGAGRESAVKGIASVGIILNAVSDVTPIPHNGCRPRKRRRV